MRVKPTLEIEESLEFRHIAGLDEAGRGALAGPVVAGAVILPTNNAAAIAQLDFVTDSKLMTAKRRAEAFDLIQEVATAWGIGTVAAAYIDKHGILPATKMAMQLALEQLPVAADYLLIDGRIRLSAVATPQQSIIRGDSESLSIAAASVLAKVYRDRLMIVYDEIYPGYGFAQHKGYGTRQHLAAIEALGASDCHRYSFAPMRNMLHD